MFLLKTKYFNKNNIIKGFTTAFLLSCFIYLAYFNIEIKIINSILGIIGIYLLLSNNKYQMASSGFFMGLFWCNWMAVSLQYYDLIYIFPLVLIGISLVYALIFYLFAIKDSIYFKAIAIFIFTFIAPFGFNWMKLELIFVDSYFSTSKIAFIVILISFVIFEVLKKYNFLALFLLIFALDFSKKEDIPAPKLDIFMPQTYVSQDLKWQKENLHVLIEDNFSLIQTAIDEKKDLIILPETSFALVLNTKKDLMHRLIELSNEINIVLGSLYYENKEIFNATYLFKQGSFEVAKKVVLVPFGEEIPLPKFFVDLINNIFYDGAVDYSKAQKPTDFIINDTKFRNAICYEGTTDKIYENLDDVKYIIMTSNNAWFTPSIEPTLQHLLLKYYSKKYSVMIFHTVNGSLNNIYK